MPPSMWKYTINYNSALINHLLLSIAFIQRVDQFDILLKNLLHKLENSVYKTWHHYNGMLGPVAIKIVLYP